MTSATRLHLVVLTPTFFPIHGGAEVGIHEIYSRVAQTHDVTIVTPHLYGPDSAEGAAERNQTNRANYRVLRYDNVHARLKATHIDKLLSSLCLRELRVLRRLNRTQPISAINIHFLFPFGLLALYARFALRIPVAVSLVGRTDVLKDLSPIRKAHAMLVLKIAKLATANSHYYTAESAPPVPVRVISYGSDMIEQPLPSRTEARALLGLPQDRFIVLAVQRLARVKRVDLVIRAFAGSGNPDGRSELVIVGDGPERESIERSAKSLMINVSFTGFVDDQTRMLYYRSADIFATHTLSETFGVMFAEAMAAGLPIVAARTSCIPYVLAEGRNAIIYSPFDLEGFAEAIKLLRSDEHMRTTMGLHNASYAQATFSWSASAAATMRLLESRNQSTEF